MNELIFLKIEGYHKFHLRIRLPLQKKIVQRAMHLVAS
jgi:hypothetical protein